MEHVLRGICLHIVVLCTDNNLRTQRLGIYATKLVATELQWLPTVAFLMPYLLIVVKFTSERLRKRGHVEIKKKKFLGG